MDITKFETDMKAQVDAVGAKLTKTIEEWRAAEAPERAKLEGKIKALEDAQASINETLAKAARMHIPGVEVGKGEKDKFSYTRLALLIGQGASAAQKTDKECGYELGVCNEMQGRVDSLPVEMKTAINAASGAGGAFLIPTTVYNDLLPELEAMSILSQLGLRQFTGLTGNLSWNRDLGGITAAYLDSEAEETGSESVPTFGMMELKPHVYAAFVPLTFGMLTQPAMAIEPWVRQRMAYKIGLLRDLSGFLGTGSNSQPGGVSLAGIQTNSWASVDTQGADQTITDEIMATMALLPESNAALAGAKLGWAFDPFSVTRLGRAKDSTGRPLLWSPQSGNIESGKGRLTQLMGHPLHESYQLGASTATPKIATNSETSFYGDWNQGGEFHWGTLAFASSDSTETNFRKLRVTIRAVGAHDFGWFQPKAFVKNTAFDSTAT